MQVEITVTVNGGNLTSNWTGSKLDTEATEDRFCDELERRVLEHLPEAAIRPDLKRGQIGPDHGIAHLANVASTEEGERILAVVTEVVQELHEDRKTWIVEA